jgi:hypothetical protein
MIGDEGIASGQVSHAVQCIQLRGARFERMFRDRRQPRSGCLLIHSVGGGPVIANKRLNPG